MRLISLCILVIIVTSYPAHGQSSSGNDKEDKKAVILTDPEEEDTNTKIFPVPVTNNRFTISSDKKFNLVRLTNIIGQETTRKKFNYPRKRAEITFSPAQKGIYLVTIQYEDKTRTVKKILIDSR